jgi:hypothetical protein
MRTGFFKIPKAILDTVMTEPGRYCQAKAVMDICMRTRYKDSDKAKKGEVVLSLRKTAQRWGWDKDTVARFIAQLIELKMLEPTNRQSIYTVNIDGDTKCDTKRDTKRDTYGDTKRAKSQRDKRTNGDSYGDSKRDSYGDSNADTTPIIRDRIDKKIENARATAASETPPPAPGMNEDGLPYGVTRKQWNQFKAWAATAIPTLWEVGITPTDFRSMRNGSLNNREKFTAILTTMEKTGKPHSVRDEFYRRLDRWEQDKFNGIYG